jgi:hypothetical protein
MNFQYFHYELIPLLLSTVMIGIMDKILKVEKNIIIDIFWICFLLNMIVILRFLYMTINQITRYLGIECFTLKKLPRKID